MRKVILSTHVTLDGFACGPNGELDWHFDHWNDEMEEYVNEQTKNVDTILVGRVTYERMAAHWPRVVNNPTARRKDIEFAWLMNTLPKVVFSRTLQKVEWNNSRVVDSNIDDEISRMKKLPGNDMILWGGVNIVQTFIQRKLIDEYNIWVAPVILGSGKPIFKNVNKLDLHLVRSVEFSNGVVLFKYLPVRAVTTQSILSYGNLQAR
jgi:dihydrofolate reductase